MIAMLVLTLVLVFALVTVVRIATYNHTDVLFHGPVSALHAVYSKRG